VLTTNCSNNYGPLPVSGKADPADDPSTPPAGKPLPIYGDGMQRA
jgi:dTDP-D-glucose 4,6-dehydratase